MVNLSALQSSSSSSSTSSSSSSTDYSRVTGMVSNLDVDNLVDSMLTGTKSKIAKQEIKIQTSQWKQDAYRTITSGLTTFNDKYYKSSSSTYAMDTSYFTSYTMASSSDYVKLSGSASNVSNIQLKNITSLATAASTSSTYKVSDNAITSGDVGMTKVVSNYAGKSMSFKINNTTVSLTLDSDFGQDLIKKNGTVTTQDVADALNAKLAEYDKSNNTNYSTSAKFEVNDDGTGLKLSNTGSYSIAVSSGTSFGFTNTSSGYIGSGESVSGTTLGDITTTKNSVDMLSGQTLTAELNGVQKKISFTDIADAGISTVDDLATYLQGKLDASFGSGKVTVGVTSSTDSSGNTTQQLTYTATDSSSVFGLVNGTTGVLGSNGVLGVNSRTYNRIDQNADIAKAGFSGTLADIGDSDYEMTINGVSIKASSTDSVYDIMNKINSSDAGVKVSYSSTSDKFSITSTETGVAAGISIADKTGNLASVMFGQEGTDYTVNAGTDTTFDLSTDGGATFQTVSRSTTSFTVDGASIELTGSLSNYESTKDKTATDGTVTSGTAVTLSATRNTDDVVKKIVNWISDYNEIVKTLNTAISTKPYSLTNTSSSTKYTALSSAQKEDMTDDEISAWEEKAKQGTLYGDRTLQTVADQLRTAITTAVEGTGLSLSDMGLSVTYASKASGNFVNNGTITVDDETKLTQAVAQQPDKVASFFGQKTGGTATYNNVSSGIMERVNSALNNAVSTSSTKAGSLVSLAGTKDSYQWDDEDSLSKEISEYQKKLEDMKDDMADEKERYYTKFSALETAMLKYNNMSDQISSLSSGSY